MAGGPSGRITLREALDRAFGEGVFIDLIQPERQAAQFLDAGWSRKTFDFILWLLFSNGPSLTLDGPFFQHSEVRDNARFRIRGRIQRADGTIFDTPDTPEGILPFGGTGTFLGYHAPPPEVLAIFPSDGSIPTREEARLESIENATPNVPTTDIEDRLQEKFGGGIFGSGFDFLLFPSLTRRDDDDKDSRFLLPPSPQRLYPGLFSRR